MVVLRFGSGQNRPVADLDREGDGLQVLLGLVQVSQLAVLEPPGGGRTEPLGELPDMVHVCGLQDVLVALGVEQLLALGEKVLCAGELGAADRLPEVLVDDVDLTHGAVRDGHTSDLAVDDGRLPRGGGQVGQVRVLLDRVTGQVRREVVELGVQQLGYVLEALVRREPHEVGDVPAGDDCVELAGVTGTLLDHDRHVELRTEALVQFLPVGVLALGRRGRRESLGQRRDAAAVAGGLGHRLGQLLRIAQVRGVQSGRIAREVGGGGLRGDVRRELQLGGRLGATLADGGATAARGQGRQACHGQTGDPRRAHETAPGQVGGHGAP
ncbi:hypothetical protein [Streptomyces sp. NPDC057284]|uniref:hypothetical protein n=1 Tax=Streptomyces sp. NPDC057284 TaxID=3346083 RepID=UPI003629236A